MRSFLFIALCVVLCNTSIAQFPGGGAPGGGRPGGGGVPNIGHFYGRIQDAKTNKGIEAASVQLILSKMDPVTKKPKDTVISGMLTRGNGDFSLENLPIFGNFRLKITAIGYKTIDQKVAFEMKMGAGRDMSQAMNAVDKDLGNFKLEQDAQVMDAVTVTGSKPLVEMGIDRKIFNVEKNINSAGGTAVDVMRNVPSLNVDIDGNVTLRNAAPQIFVDGRPTTLTLDQIPADAIQSIEMITNPSAKYDASGGQAGILNIVLKKNRKAGYNGSIRAGIDSRARINAGGDINVRQGKLNVFANAMYNQRKSIGWGWSDQSSSLNGKTTHTYQDNDQTNRGSFAFGRFGLDYFMDNRNTLSISQSLVRGQFKNNNLENYTIDTMGIFSESQYRNTQGEFEFRNYGTQLSFKHLFAKSGKELTADVNYNMSRNDNESNILFRSFDDRGQLNPKGPEGLQKSIGEGKNTFVVVQTDYVNPITETMKWEAGLRGQMRKSESEQLISTNGNQNAGLSNKFEYTDYVWAGYATFSQKIKDKWSYQLGLRAESSNYEGEQLNKQEYSNSFPISLFPSVFITRNFENKQDFQVNYSRRINRPNFFQLMPNYDISNVLSYQTGNPNLTPEFTHSLELSYQKTYGKSNNTFLATIFGKYTTDLIARYQDSQVVDGTKRYVTSWINASDAYAAGVELVFRNNWTKWWDMNFSTNVYYSKISGDVEKQQLSNERTSYSAKLNNTFKIAKGWSIQLSGDYISKSALPVSTSNSGGGGGRGMGGGGGFMGPAPSSVQGFIDANYGADLGLRKEFQLWKNTATVSVNWSDIFRSRRYYTFSESASFSQTDWRRRDPQVVRVNFNYRFGKFDIGLFKRKNMKGESEGMQNGMQGVGQ
ncbi:TonB-dependent receptor [Paraflavitalea sp. CAU 1676]|uniref:TonB-dependent receptor domain-containing protein n=1 Tax=Paraflavitalea sp. CAU 1676 TaxID=3032598 RepID=UPI0023DBE19D|nr:TonB-dependent receptor [Paraflavitalea sp. CAU 1676]MDF2189337.1 TonB-dependent receptor [Paraflavitalea sp. CAU 1676]